METNKNQRRKVILLIDDEPVIRRLFGGRLAQLGYELIYGADGNEGRELARRLKPDLILLDLNMPVMNGIEAARRMKSEDETKDIPIVILSNEDLSIESQKTLKELGARDYAHKSEEFQKLASLIEKIFNSSALH